MMLQTAGNMSRKTIVVSAENYDALKKLGHVGDSFDDAIGALLSKIVNKEEKIKEAQI